MGREVGEGFRMGNTCTPVADSCQCMAKPIQYCKVKKKNNNNKFKEITPILVSHSVAFSLYEKIIYKELKNDMGKGV